MAIVKGTTLTLADAVDLSVNWTSDIIDTAGFTQGSIEYHVPSNTHVGVFSLLAGNVPDLALMQVRYFASKTGGFVTAGTVSITSGTAFDNIFSLTTAVTRYVALSYAATSGAGLLNAWCGWSN